MNKLSHALIMAAGRGTRMKPITDAVPKPMIMYGGYTLIERGIRKLAPHVKNIHITVGYKGAMLASHVVELGVASVFNTEGHGNGWWIYNTVMAKLNEPLVVLTADNVTDLDFAMLGSEYERLGEPACMIVPVLPVDGLDGDYIHHVQNEIIELNRLKPSPIYCSGIQIINPAKINAHTAPVEDFYEIWAQLIQKKMIKCSDVYPERWFTVDTEIQLNLLKERGQG
jgi:NDP-sugar pyrophosphorylase family protein